MESIKSVECSLVDLLGRDYINSVIEAQCFLTGSDRDELNRIANEKVDFFPDSFQTHLDDLIPQLGKKVVEGFSQSPEGAGTTSFQQATNSGMSPIGGIGCFRLGEDGRLYFTGKSEHYHASLGHNFPGYQLIQNAVKLGISNCTHNNTRGYITRLAEKEIVRIANGIARDDHRTLQQVLDSNEPRILNRVINLQTGSLAMEAALKMMLARFFKLDKTFNQPKYAGKTPVFIVMADHEGGKQANYHGTTVLTQMMRELWPDLYQQLEKNDILIVKSCPINDAQAFESLVETYDKGPYKVAGFFHELVLMNYGAIRLSQEFVDKTHQKCRQHDIPIVVDEIQSCMWSPELFLFKEYNCHPDFVSVGKGFPGGQYSASKILTTAEMDNLNQFGALVTNGQEELASLSYLITIRFAEENRDYTRSLGSYYEAMIKKLACDFSQTAEGTEGVAHMTSLVFKSPEDAASFANTMNQTYCIDVSAQTYKANCPPVALTKIPLITSYAMVDDIAGKMAAVLSAMQSV